MQNMSWDAIYTDGSDWYDNFINLVYTKFQQSFPLVRLSRKPGLGSSTFRSTWVKYKYF